MQWTTEKPTQSGYYWIYTTPMWEDKPCVMIVEVNVNNNNITFNIPCDGMEREDLISPGRTTHYMGIVSEPEPPKG